MKYVSLDIETTCLERNPANILGLSMVVEDTEKDIPIEELPHLTVIINQPVITGSAFALGLNSWILDYISGRSKNSPYPIITPDQLEPLVYHFLSQYCCDPSFSPIYATPAPKGVILAGKNVASFDYQFLPADIQSFFAHRMIDPGSVCIDWTKPKPLSLEELLQTKGFDKEVSHDMLEDARDVIRVLRTSYPKHHTTILPSNGSWRTGP